MNYLNPTQIRALLTMADYIEIMRELFLLDPQQDIINPLRPKLMMPNGGILGMMPAYIRPYQAMGIKVISVYAQNHQRGLSSHQGIIHLFDAENGSLKLSLDADEVTAMRTAAVSALMTDLLALDHAETLGLLGTGTQASSHLEAITLVRPIKTVKVWSPNPAHVQRFIQDQQARYALQFEACHSAEMVANGADIICTLTSSAQPLLIHDWLKDGVHLNVVGASTPNAREVATDVVLHTKVFVDNYESACHEAGDLLLALGSPEQVRATIKADIHALLRQPLPALKQQKTLFKSLGLAIEDLAVAHYCWQKMQH